jgi:hypothetical protein
MAAQFRVSIGCLIRKLGSLMVTTNSQTVTLINTTFIIG